MSKDFNWRRGRWETDNITDAHELKQTQPDPVWILDRKTKKWKEYKEKTHIRSPKIRHGRFIDTVGSDKDDIWD